MTGPRFRRTLLAATAVLVAAMTATGAAPAESQTVRVAALAAGFGTMLAGLLLIVTGIHLLYTGTRRSHRN